MKKFLIILFLIFCSGAIFSNEFGDIDIVYQGKKIGSMPVIEFKELVTGAKKFSELVKSEDNKRIIIELKDSPMPLTLKSTYETDVYIKWLNEKHEIIKTLVLENKITLKKEHFNKYRIMYRDVSEFGFPISTILLLFLMAL